MTDISSESIHTMMMPSMGPGVSSLLAPDMLSTMTMTSVSDFELNGILEEIGFFDDYNEETIMLPMSGSANSPCQTPPPSSPPPLMSSSTEPSLATTMSSDDVDQQGDSNPYDTNNGSLFVPVSPDRRSTESPQPNVSPSSDGYNFSYSNASNTFIAPKPSMASSMSVVSVSSTVTPAASSSMMNYSCYNNDAPQSSSSSSHYYQGNAAAVVSPTEPSMRPVFNPLQPATSALAAAMAASSQSSPCNNNNSNNNMRLSSLPPMAWPPSPPSMMAPHQVTSSSSDNNPRKRRFDSGTKMASSACNGHSNTTLSTASLSNTDEKFLTGDELEARRERNRVHAKKSRLRKKGLTETLQDSLTELKEENAKLREMIFAKIGKQATNDLVQKRIQDSHSNFISALTDPTHRVVDAKTISFLKGLRKSLHPAPAAVVSTSYGPRHKKGAGNA